MGDSVSFGLAGFFRNLFVLLEHFRPSTSLCEISLFNWIMCSYERTLPEFFRYVAFASRQQEVPHDDTVILATLALWRDWFERCYPFEKEGVDNWRGTCEGGQFPFLHMFAMMHDIAQLMFEDAPYTPVFTFTQEMRDAVAAFKARIMALNITGISLEDVVFDIEDYRFRPCVSDEYSMSELWEMFHLFDTKSRWAYLHLRRRLRTKATKPRQCGNLLFLPGGRIKDAFTEQTTTAKEWLRLHGYPIPPRRRNRRQRNRA